MTAPRVAIVGGGLAGLSAALALAERGFCVELFEARRLFGGRASSYRDPSGEQVDYCQHASMGCCTNLADFCRRTGIAHHFERFRRLHFIGPRGERCDVAASAWLPAPLHLTPALLGLRFLSFGERLRLATALWRLAHSAAADDPAGPTMAQWLVTQKQSQRVIDQFWSLILTSALAESLERISVSAARQVFVQGFLASRTAYELLVPTLPLGELFGTIVPQRLAALGVKLHAGAAVECVVGDAGHITGIRLAGGMSHDFYNVVLAVPWRHVADLLPAAMQDIVPLGALAKWPASPITGIHLWFDRPITPLPHAVLVGRLSQWLFVADRALPGAAGEPAWYCQVVVSASRMLLGGDRQQIVDEVCRELRELSPETHGARLLDWKLISDRNAVFSPLPGLEAVRPSQRTPIAGLTLAGDWTKTGWPATMEGAVRSGYLAAEAVLAERGPPQNFLVPDLPRGRLARWLLGM